MRTCFCAWALWLLQWIEIAHRFMLEAWTLAIFSKMMVGLCGRLLRCAEVLEHLHHHLIMRGSLPGQFLAG